MSCTDLLWRLAIALLTAFFLFADSVSAEVRTLPAARTSLLSRSAASGRGATIRSREWIGPAASAPPTAGRPCAGTWRRSRSATASSPSFEGRGEVYTDLEGEVQSTYYGADLFGFRTKRDDSFSLYAEQTFERLHEPFEVRPGVVIPAGEYRWDHEGIWSSLGTSTTRSSFRSSFGSKG